MPVVTKKKPGFNYYLHLPRELRFMVIDEMEPVDKCKFSQSARLCYAETKASRSYLYALEVSGDRLGTVVVIDVKFDKDQGFHLLFNDDDGNKSVECMTLQNETKWISNLDKTVDLVEHAMTHFKNLLGCYQNTIKSLKISGELFSHKLVDFDFGVRSFTNLDELILDEAIYVQQLLSKVRKPLKKLEVFGEIGKEVLESCEQIYRVEDCLHLPNTQFTAKQFFELPASCISIPIGELTAEHIVNIIKSWQNDTSGKEIRCYEWRYMQDSHYRGLVEAISPNIGETDVWFQHHDFLENGEHACLYYKDYTSLVFKTNP